MVGKNTPSYTSFFSHSIALKKKLALYLVLKKIMYFCGITVVLTFFHRKKRTMKTDSIIKGGAGMVASVAEAQIVAPTLDLNNLLSAVVQVIIAVATLVSIFRRK